MKLWSDYEGRTIAEAYPLKKLVRPEGRSAFFLTTNGTGTPALVRVIEAHFDESEILTRWKTISEIGQENLITMRKFGEAELDGTPLVYAVMEPTEISLAELLENRTLTAEETRELAHSLVAALQALHQRDLVHGQIEAENILAVGETVKLRSDCIREAASHPDSDGPTIAELKAQDAHAVAVVLLQALTGRTSLQGSATLLPSPFDGIIRNGLSGRWGLAEMAAALGPAAPKPAPAAVKPVEPVTAAPLAMAATTTTVADKTETATDKAETAPVVAAKTEPGATPTIEAVPAATKAATPAPKQENLFTPAAAASAKPVTTSAKYVAESLAAEKTVAPAPDVRRRFVQPVEERDTKHTRMWVAAAVAVLVLLVLGWRMMHSEPSASTNGTARPVSTLADPNISGKGATTPAPTKPSATGNTASRTPAPVITGGAGAKTQWRVVAFTYNHEDQAKQKAEAIQKQRPSLNAEVFSPTGHAPYLVTVGGPMSREAAVSFKAKARGQGMPRDLYAQNYSR